MGIDNNFKFIKNNIRKITEYPLIEIEDQLAIRPPKQKIPPIVYQTWENNFFGKTHFKQIQKFRNINNNLTFKLYDKKLRDEYMNERWSNHSILDVYKKVKLGVMESDIFRHCILYDKGGYYFDISKGCNIALRSLHKKDTEVLISNEPVECIIPPEREIFSKLKFPLNNFLTWGLGFKKHHPIPKSMIEAISLDHIHYSNKVFHRPKLAVLALTATGQFTKCVREYFISNNHDKVIQSGIYFEGNGIFSMKGCRVRHHLVKSYADIENEKVI